MEAANKMQNIINSLSEPKRKQYKSFYYVIICPSYGEKIMKKYFNEEFTSKEQKESFRITENDYCRYPLEGNKLLNRKKYEYNLMRNGCQ